MSESNKLLNRHHPFVVVLGISAVVVAAVLLFNLGSSLSSGTTEADTAEPDNRVTHIDQIPPFSLPDTEGVVHSLSDWQGKVILLNFWATWCPPCKYEIPDFMEFQSEYGEAGFQIVGIGIDEPENIRQFNDDMGINYPLLTATDPEMMNHWGNRQQVLPYSVVIDRAGEIRYIHRGQLQPSTFERTILPLITSQSTSEPAPQP